PIDTQQNQASPDKTAPTALANQGSTSTGNTSSSIIYPNIDPQELGSSGHEEQSSSIHNHEFVSSNKHQKEKQKEVDTNYQGEEQLKQENDTYNNSIHKS
ncbi:1291_t:CDS:2, partial [Racocetra fulgida]